MGEIKRLLQDRFETRRSQLPARVTSIPLDADGKGLGYVLAEIAGNPGVRVRVGPSDNYYPGDWLAAEQIGGGAGAQYVARGYVPGSRPQSGVWEITTPTTIGTEVFDAGDVVHGNPYDTHWWYDYSAGRWYVRQGSTTHGALGFLADTYDYAVDSPAVGFAFGDEVATWLSGDDVNGFRIFSGSTQRVALNPDGSGWFVDPAVFAWDTSGNLALAGDFKANSLRIGPQHGPTLFGGVVTDYDDAGQPLPDAQQGGHFGLWIEDYYGRRRVALLTGTADWPDQPALFVGAVDDASYLRYEGDRLTVKGRIIGDEGEFARFQILEHRLESVNQKIRLIAEADDEFGEGLVLVTGPTTADAGTVRWNDPDPPPSRPNYTLGIKMCYYDDAYGGWVMQSQTTTPYGDDTSPTKHVWISGTWGSTQNTMEFDRDGFLTAPYLKANSLGGYGSRLGFSDVVWTRRLAGLTINTNLGGVARVSEHQGGFTGAPATQLPVNAAEVTIALPHERPPGVSAHYLRKLIIKWQKTISGAYFEYVKVLQRNTNDGTVTEIVSYADLRQADGAARYTDTIIDDTTTPADIYLEAHLDFFLVLKTAGVSNANHLLLHHVEMTYSDSDTLTV
jgi:hypothetical protein